MEPITFIGIDPSINGTGFFRMDFDESGNVTFTDNFAFGLLTTKKKNKFEGSSNIIAYWKDQFEGDRFKQYKWTIEKIMERVPTDRKVVLGIEGYAMGAGGMVFDIGEFVGFLTVRLRHLPNLVMKEYPPMTVKMLMSGRGDADKAMMCNHFNNDPAPYKPDLTHLDDYKSPRADIVDAWHICHLAMNDYLKTDKFDSFRKKKPVPKSLAILEYPWFGTL